VFCAIWLIVRKVVEEKVVIHRGKCKNIVYYLTIWSLGMEIATFRLLTACLLQAMSSTDCTASYISQRSAVIGAFRPSLCSLFCVHGSCSLSGETPILLDIK